MRTRGSEGGKGAEKALFPVLGSGKGSYPGVNGHGL